MQVLIAVQPLNLSTGARETVRVASAQDRRITGLSGQVWVPALIQSPVLAIRLFDGDFSSSVEPGSATFAVNLGEVGQTYANAYAYLWAGAPVSIYAEEPGTAWPWARRFVGKVRQFEKDGKRLQLVAEVDTAALEKDVLYLKYAGTTGLEGGADLKDRVRPWVLGHVKGIEPVQIDIDNSVFQVSGYGAIGGIPAIYERGSSFGSSMGNYANYAALVAATIPPGRWATCLSQGLFRLGAPPFGVITADVQGHLASGSVPRRTGLIIQVIASALSISSDSINAASLDALDAAVARNINIYLTEQVTFIDLAQQLCLPCNAYSGMSWDGKFFAVRPQFGSAALTLHGQGRADPPVLKMIEGGVNPPFKKTIFGADRCWRIHSTNEIAYQDILVDRGRYSGSETYRAGNIVDLADGSRWLYTADTATTGNPPEIGSGFWTLISGQVEPVYEDGTPIRDLQPAEPGATNGAPGPSPVGDRTAQEVVDDLDINAAAIIAQALRQDDLDTIFDFRTLVEGQPVSTEFFEFRQEQITENSAFASNFTLLGAKTPDGTAWNLAVDLVKVDGDTTLAQKFSEIGATTGEITASVQFLQEVLIDDTGGLARFTLLGNVDGQIVGISGTSDGVNGDLVFVGTSFTFVDNSGENPIIPLSYADGRWKMTDVFIEKLEVGAVVTDSIDPFAIRKRYITRLASNTSLPNSGGASITVLSIVATKDEADSDIEVSFFARVRPGDDYAGYFQIEYTIGASTTVHDTIWYWKPSVVLGGFRSARGTEGHRDYISGLPSGSITFTLKFFYHAGSASGGFMEQGTNFAIEEIKR